MAAIIIVGFVGEIIPVRLLVIPNPRFEGERSPLGNHTESRVFYLHVDGYRSVLVFSFLFED
jgi:hypothetical protein